MKVFIQTLGWSWDILIIVGLIAGSVLNTMTLGRRQAVSMLVSLYMASAITIYFPFEETLAGTFGTTPALMNVSIFIAATLLISVLIVRSKLKYLLDRHERMDMGQIFLLSVLEVGMLLSMILSFSDQLFLETLRPLTQSIFTSGLAQFLWVTLPVVSLISMKR